MVDYDKNEKYILLSYNMGAIFWWIDMVCFLRVLTNVVYEYGKFEKIYCNNFCVHVYIYYECLFSLLMNIFSVV